MHSSTVLLYIAVMTGMVTLYLAQYSVGVWVTFLFLFALSVSTVIYLMRRVCTVPVSRFAAALFIGLSLGLIQAARIQDHTFVSCKQCSYEGVVTSIPVVGSDDMRYKFKSTAGDTYIIIDRRTNVIHKGDVVTVSGVVTTPKAGQQGEGYRHYLELQDVSGIMMRPRVAVREHAHSIATNALEHARVTIRMYVGRPESVLATGVLFGDIERSDTITDSMRKSGLSHITALSGANIAIWITLGMVLMRKRSVRTKVFVIALVLAMYLIVIPLQASIIRAAIMGGVALGALVLGRVYFAQIGLLVSGLMFLVFSPHSVLYDVGFHLSFIATAVIVFLGPVIFARLRLHIIQKTMVVSCAVSLAVGVYASYVFGTISYMGFLATMIVEPIVWCTMVLTLMLVIFGGFIPVIGYALGAVITTLCKFVLSVSDFFAFGYIEGVHLSGYIVAVSSVMFLGVLLATLFVNTENEKSVPHLISQEEQNRLESTMVIRLR